MEGVEARNGRPTWIVEDTRACALVAIAEFNIGRSIFIDGK